MAHNTDSPYPTPNLSETGQQWLHAEVSEARARDSSVDPEALLAALIKREQVIDEIAAEGGVHGADKHSSGTLEQIMSQVVELKDPGS